MTISETYEKFKHFDRLLSDREWLPQSIHGVLLHEFWMAIRDAAQPTAVSAHAPVTESREMMAIREVATRGTVQGPAPAPVVEYGGVDNDG